MSTYSNIKELQQAINALVQPVSAATEVPAVTLGSLLWSQRRVTRDKENFALPTEKDLTAAVKKLQATVGVDSFIALRDNGELRRMPERHSRMVSAGTFEKPDSLVREAERLAENARNLGPRGLHESNPDEAQREIRLKEQEQRFAQEDAAKRDVVRISLNITPAERKVLDTHSLKDLPKSPSMSI